MHCTSCCNKNTSCLLKTDLHRLYQCLLAQAHSTSKMSLKTLSLASFIAAWSRMKCTVTDQARSSQLWTVLSVSEGSPNASNGSPGEQIKP